MSRMSSCPHLQWNLPEGHDMSPYIEFLSLLLPLPYKRYDTAYECEGKTLKIECREGELINLIRANYGRFSITICNEHGNTDWSVNCMSQKSFRVLYGSYVSGENEAALSG
ncbi:hypothetical protein PV325_006176 [Microctonus aethiopoides]|nr:hypothetical protein PV325_006176 [Microctonus aethiopoides]